MKRRIQTTLQTHPDEEASQAQIIEALLFSSQQSLSIQQISRITGIRNQQTIGRHIQALNRFYKEHQRAFSVQEVAGGYQLRTDPRFQKWIRRGRVVRPIQLSQSVMETLSIIAYQQPITRAEIEDIRTVDATYALRTLLNKRLIRVIGRKDIMGRPLLYGTSKLFLEVFGFNSLADLPRPVYSDFFREHSVITAQALLTAGNFRWKDSFQNMKAALEGLLENDIMPIINENDVTSHRESSFGDNDQLAALTAAMMNADLLVLVSDIVGFFTADPKKNPDARLINRVERITPDLMELCENSLSEGGTGGMLSKLKAADLATRHGIPTIVCSGTEPDCLIRAGRHETSGTYFVPVNRKKQLSLRGNWMTTAADVKGTITIDAGAEKALKKDKSLLAVGVIGVEGKFNKKDVILIQNQEGFRIGAGLANHSCSEIRSWIGESARPKGVIVVHKNHLYTL